MTTHSGPVLALLLAIFVGLAPGVVHGSDNNAAQRLLLIDFGTFAPIEAESTARSRPTRALGHVGPQIVLRLPQDDSVFAPKETVSVHIEFLPAADGTEPNMNTLKVRVRKGWFGKDITEVVEPYVDGRSVRVPAVDFKGYTGQFQFEIRIRDFEDRVGEAQFSVRIQG